MTQEEINEVRQIVADYLNENGGVVEEVTAIDDSDLDNTISIPGYDSDTLTYVRVPISLLQKVLVSGTNIKTINGTSLLGSGNITILDSALMAEYGETLYSDITRARGNGLPVFCIKATSGTENIIMPLVKETSTAYAFAAVDTSGDVYIAMVTNANAWYTSTVSLSSKLDAITDTQFNQIFT